MLEALRRETSRFGLDIILIDVWEGVDARSEADFFRQVWDIQGTILLDETGDYARSLGIRGVPTNVVVDAEGIVRAVGVTAPDELHPVIDALLGR